jgi:hypothetical protein
MFLSLRKIWFLPATLTLLVFVCGAASVLAVKREPAKHHADLLEARSRWSSRPFDAYLMRLRDRGCRMEVEVRSERVVKTRYATRPCEQPPVAVRDLFDLVERHGTVRRTCVSRGCACDDILSVRAEYHPTLGYPQTIEITLTPDAELAPRRFLAGGVEYPEPRRLSTTCRLGSRVLTGGVADAASLSAVRRACNHCSLHPCAGCA